MQTREAARIFGRERQTVLIAMNGFMLGTVIAEHALDILHAANKPDVEHENNDAHNAVDDVPKKRFVVVLANEHVRDERRRDDEQADAQKQAKRHRDSHFALAKTVAVPIASLGRAGLDRIELDRAGFSRAGLGHVRLGGVRLDNDVQGALCAQSVNRFTGIAEIIFPREAAGVVHGFFAGQNHRRFCCGLPCIILGFIFSQTFASAGISRIEGAMLFMARTLFFIRAFAKAQMSINGLGARNVLGRSVFLRNGPVRVCLFGFL